jgi:hypothetical protein
VSPAAQQRCPQCTAPVEVGQEYCVECGLRLTGEAPGSRSPLPGERSHAWLGPAFVALIVAALGAGASIAISSDGDVREAISTATGGSLTITGTGPLLTAPEPTTKTKTSTAPAATTPKPPPVNPAFATWPRPQRGWTIVLLSLPQSGGRAAADEQADTARQGGLRRVGVINSSRFASLHPGYYVVFTGVFETQTEAVSALQRARAVFPSAYVREIIP